MTQNPKTSFKKSNISWIGEIPEYWEVKKLKFVFKYTTGGTPSSGKSDYYDSENGYNWITISDLNGKYTGESKNKITELAIKEANMEIVPRGSLLYSFKLSVGQVAFVSEDTYTNEAIISIFPKEGLNLNFWYYALPAYFISNANENIYGAKIFNQFTIDNGLILTPPLPTQTLIANFLDQKTTEIKKLVENKRKLIELLKEQKQSIIHRAVTRGIDPNVKMKDSGIPWIGEIPEDWEVRKLKHFLNVLTDFTANGSFGDLAKNVNYLDAGYSRVVRLTDLRVNFENPGIYVTEEAHNYLRKSELFGGELLIANVGAYTGYVCLMPKVKFIATLGPNMFLLRFNNKILDSFIYNFLLSDFGNKQFIIEADSSAQPKLNKYEVKNMIIFLPSITEQKLIVEYIEKETSQIDSAIAKIEQEIALIEEYQSSLIYQAVTGKISIP